MERSTHPCTGARQRIAALAITALLATAALAPSAAGADGGAASAATQPKRMKIAFSGRTARVAGPGAMVPVKCLGDVAGSCEGTLSLSLGGAAQEVPYTLARGEKRIVVVPLGASERLLEGPAAATALAVAETVQPTGAVVASKHRLRLR